LEQDLAKPLWAAAMFLRKVLDTKHFIDDLSFEKALWLLEASRATDDKS
jgi:hypothetical protein